MLILFSGSDVGSNDAVDDYGSEKFDSENEIDELGSLNDIETKSRFTDYSMTSSVMRRNYQLRHLDDRFEEVTDYIVVS